MDVVANDLSNSYTAARAPLKVQIALFNGFDLLDAIAPYEVFLAAGELTAVPVHVELVSAEGARDVPCGVSGVRIPASAALAPRDGGIVLVPGAAGKVSGDGSESVPQLLLQASQTQLSSAMREAMEDPDVIVATVCGGSLILAMADLLKGRCATTHHMGLGLLSALGALPMSGRVVDDGDLVTGGGVTSGLDVALYLLERELGADVALGVEKLFEYERRGTVWRSASLNGQRPDTEAVSQLHEISVNKPASTLDAGDEHLANRFIGVWKVELATPIGALQITLDISSLQGILHGRATQGDQTESFHDISLHGDCLQWTQRVTKPMRLTLRFSVTVEADVMTGTAKAGLLPASRLTGSRIIEVHA
ncbi:DJ-1/PfpI family protein [Pseudomonas aeruginosa]|nr:DJ-1/PfpI family protein [Pseudomonas aeruginosa]MBX6303115.1 DJ-1/PfpI family protein [Pseudomonas aeruginosa]MBX6566250.1 DJ-1/PfpI family protein [Pseudomonas aeruginosa]MBX6647749.1 DJ-1/PfpI family protein [Pseudomonas aeruginosa]MBX6802437.1 DJ-1/PfpI family protein [Pseudomonas aeruginosa]